MFWRDRSVVLRFRFCVLSNSPGPAFAPGPLRCAWASLHCNTISQFCQFLFFAFASDAASATVSGSRHVPRRDQPNSLCRRPSMDSASRRGRFSERPVHLSPAPHPAHGPFAEIQGCGNHRSAPSTDTSLSNRTRQPPRSDWERSPGKETRQETGVGKLTYDDLVELARLCFKEARDADNPAVRAEFHRMGQGYRMRAASQNQGRLPGLPEDASCPR